MYLRVSFTTRKQQQQQKKAELRAEGLDSCEVNFRIVTATLLAAISGPSLECPAYRT